MSRGSYPLLLTMALSAPGAAQALGLGEIHIDSKLNQPLSAHIDIVGANESEIAGLRAAVASREIFQQFGADRPAFLSTAHFKVSRDEQGRPVLSVRSSDAFTDPVVNLLVELNWGTGRLVREYTLLLDPDGFGGAAADASKMAAPTAEAVAAAAPAAPAAPAAGTADLAPEQPVAAELGAPASNPVAVDAAPALPAPVTTSRAETPPAATSRPAVASAPASGTSEPGDTHTVRANETLGGIARQWGMRSTAEVRRMMIAAFRANPDAFEGNINRLRRGAALRIPTSAELAELSAYEVNRDYRAQMSQWRLAGRPASTAEAGAAEAAAASQPLPVADEPRAPAPVNTRNAASVEPVAQPATDYAAASPAGSAPVTNDSNAEIAQQIQKLESAIAEMNEQLARRDAQLRELREQADAAAADAARAAAAHEIELAEAAAARHNSVIAKRTAAAIGTAGSIAALFALLRMRRSKPAKPVAPQAAAAPPDDIEDLEDIAVSAPAQAPAPATTAEPVPVAKATPNSAPAVVPPAPPAAASTAVTTPRPNAAAKPDPAEEETIILDTNGDTTKNMAMDPTVVMAHEEIIADLENTAHHVNMPSDLNSPAQSGPFVERRRSVIDVLRAAIEREPHRRELKMKLLELYYAAAASNQAAFLEVAKALGRDRDVLATGDWERIMAMGRNVTPNEHLFLPDEQPEDSKDVTDSAA